MQPGRFQDALEVLGISAKEVNKGMVTDAQGIILKILDMVNSLDKTSRRSQDWLKVVRYEYAEVYMEPLLKAKVKFRNWTRNNTLRTPSFVDCVT
jgi:hypothetical protein